MPRIYPNVEELTRKRIENVTCEIVGCGKHFKHSLALRFHKVKVHNIVQNDLDKRLIWKGGNQVKPTNNQYHCPHLQCPYFFTDVYSKSFNSFGLLRQHYNTVHGDKKHQCTNCGVMFSRKGDLRRHMASCEGRKCGSCRVRMSDRKSLEQHCRLLKHQLPPLFSDQFNLRNYHKSVDGGVKSKLNKKIVESSDKNKKGFSQILKNKKEISILPKKTTISNITQPLNLPAIITLNSDSSFIFMLPTMTNINSNNNASNSDMKSINTNNSNTFSNGEDKNNINIKIHEASLLISSIDNTNNNNIVNNKMDNNIHNAKNVSDFPTLPKYPQSSSSSSSSRSSPLYKAVQIQTIGSSRKSKKSQGSQVVTKTKRSCLRTEHNHTQTTPTSPPNHHPPLRNPLNVHQPPPQFSSYYPPQQPSSSSLWTQLPRNSFSDCQTQTLQFENGGYFEERYNSNENDVHTSVVCGSGMAYNFDNNTAFNMPYNNEVNCNMLTNTIINYTDSRNNLDNNAVENDTIDDANKLINIDNNSTNNITYNNTIGNNAYNNTINNNTYNNNTINDTSELLYHQDTTNNSHSTETQTSFSWCVDDLKYLTEHLLSPTYIPAECLTSAETQTTNTDLPDLSDICDLLDTSDITTQTPLFLPFLHTEEAHTQTYDLDFNSPLLH